MKGNEPVNEMPISTGMPACILRDVYMRRDVPAIVELRFQQGTAEQPLTVENRARLHSCGPSTHDCVKKSP